MRPSVIYPFESNNASEQFGFTRFFVNGKQGHDNVLHLVFNKSLVKPLGQGTLSLGYILQSSLQARWCIVRQPEMNASSTEGPVGIHPSARILLIVHEGTELNEAFTFMAGLKGVKLISDLP